MANSDSLYHRLFSHPQMVEALVREFVPPAMLAGLDFSGLQRANVKFHTHRRKSRREGDVIWRLPTHAGSDIYLYLMIEFQSKSDVWMAVRTQVYQGLLWQQVIDEKKLEPGGRLPPLLLLVLYNGEPRWNAPTSTRELIALPPGSALWRWQPQARYHLLDMGAFPKDELARRSNLTSLLFRLERRHSPKELRVLLDEVIGWFRQHPSYERLQGLFAELIRAASERHGLRLSSSNNLLEVKSMLADNFKEWREQFRAEGLAAGKAEGLAEGKAEGTAEGKVKGKAEDLLLLLTKRFGTVAPSWRKRVNKAKLATIECWFERAIAAPDLRSIFNSPR